MYRRWRQAAAQQRRPQGQRPLGAFVSHHTCSFQCSIPSREHGVRRKPSCSPTQPPYRLSSRIHELARCAWWPWRLALRRARAQRQGPQAFSLPCVLGRHSCRCSHGQVCGGHCAERSCGASLAETPHTPPAPLLAAAAAAVAVAAAAAALGHRRRPPCRLCAQASSAGAAGEAAADAPTPKKNR